MPAYVILPDRSLIDMARRKPATPAEMAQVHGVGELKLARYGEEFLEVIREHRRNGKVALGRDPTSFVIAGLVPATPITRHGRARTSG